MKPFIYNSVSCHNSSKLISWAQFEVIKNKLALLKLFGNTFKNLSFNHFKSNQEAITIFLVWESIANSSSISFWAGHSISAIVLFKSKAITFAFDASNSILSEYFFYFYSYLFVG